MGGRGRRGVLRGHGGQRLDAGATATGEVAVGPPECPLTRLAPLRLLRPLAAEQRRDPVTGGEPDAGHRVEDAPVNPGTAIAASPRVAANRGCGARPRRLPAHSHRPPVALSWPVRAPDSAFKDVRSSAVDRADGKIPGI